MVTEEDIKQQESKVNTTRKKLEELLAAIEKANREDLLKNDLPMSADPSEVSRFESDPKQFSGIFSLEQYSSSSRSCDHLRLK